MKKLIVCPKQR